MAAGSTRRAVVSVAIAFLVASAGLLISGRTELRAAGRQSPHEAAISAHWADAGAALLPAKLQSANERLGQHRPTRAGWPGPVGVLGCLTLLAVSALGVVHLCQDRAVIGRIATRLAPRGPPPSLLAPAS